MPGDHDIEKGHLPQDLDSVIQHPGVSTEQDGEKAPRISNSSEDSISERSHRVSSVDTTEASPPDEAQDVARTRSRPTSVQSRMSIIPRSKRRGLLGRFTIIPEVERPHEYARGTKWLITFLIALAAAAAPMGSAIFLPALPQLAVELGASTTITNLSVALYMLSMSIFPLWWSSFSETLGRRTIYIVSFSLFVIFAILSAVSVNISMLVVMRLLSGGAAASVQAVGAGTVADIWEVKERGRAMGIFYLGPLMGPLLAPIVGGALAEHFGWRSTQWFLAIYGGCLIIILTFCLPETLPTIRKFSSPPTAVLATNDGDSKNPSRPQLSRVSTRQSIQVRTKTTFQILHRIFIEPLYVLRYLRFPAVALTVYYASITFGSLYMLSISIQQTFSRAPYKFSETILGLMYLPNSLGYIASSLIGGPWCDRIMQREARTANRYDENGKLVFIPEDRMRENAWLAAAVYPGALLWYGWAVDRGVHWVVPCFALFFFGLGSMLVFSCATTMLTEFMPRKSSSGVAVNNFARNILSCVAGIVAAPLIDKATNGWVFTGLAIICWCSSGVIFALRRYGPKWRETMTKEIAKEIAKESKS